jgi:hypothetical protein
MNLYKVLIKSWFCLVFILSADCFAYTRDGLIGEYNFSDNTATDSSGNGKHGIIHSTQAIADRNNNPSSAIMLNGQDAWVEVPSSALYNSLTNITLSLWIRPQRGPNGENRAGSLMGKQPSGYRCTSHTSYNSNHGGLFDFDLCYQDNALKLYFCSQFNGDGSEGHIANMPSLEYNEWQHIAITASKTENRVKFYVNGALVDDIVYSVYINYGRILSQINAEPLRIGKRKDADFNQNLYFIGGMDDVKIYNRELSASEIEELADLRHYSVTLHPNDGSEVTNVVFATYNEPMPPAPLPSRNGWVFNGYYDQLEGGVQYYTPNMASARNWLNTSNMTLYAQWSSCGVVRFKAPLYSVSESGTALAVQIERVNGSRGPASVTVVSEEGTATEDNDYAGISATYTWADGNTATKTLYVGIIPDDQHEGNETFYARLTNVTGAIVDEFNSAQVTIVDDDIAESRIIRIETGLESEALEFGNVATNASLAKTVQVWNDGNQPLAVTNITVSAGFSVTQHVFTVAAGNMVPLTIFFEPTLLQDYSALIEFSCVAATGVATLPVAGTGVEPARVFAQRAIAGQTAIIAIEVPTNATVLAIEDSLSSEVAPLQISDGGSWDPVNRKVKWFFDKKVDIRDRALQYTVSASGNVLMGQVSFGEGGSYPITGDTLFAGGENPGLLHPADIDGSWSVNQAEIAASISRWKSGQENLKTPIAVRGITLYLQGELYAYNANISAEAKRWVPSGVPLMNPVASPLFVAFSSPEVSAVRSVYSNSVMISVTPLAGTTAYGIEEYVASGVTVGTINNDGIWDGINRKIKWAFYDAEPRVLSYSFSGPEGIQASLSGTASFDGSEDQISGQIVATVPLMYNTWVTSRGLAGNAADFNAINPERREPNGILYAFGNNLFVSEPTMEVKWIDGELVVETPLQDLATMPFVTIEILGSSDLTAPNWTMKLQPHANQAGVPAHRCRWKMPVTETPCQAFFRIRVNNK